MTSLLGDPYLTSGLGILAVTVDDDCDNMFLLGMVSLDLACSELLFPLKSQVQSVPFCEPRLYRARETASSSKKPHDANPRSTHHAVSQGENTKKHLLDDLDAQPAILPRHVHKLHVTLVVSTQAAQRPKIPAMA